MPGAAHETLVTLFGASPELLFALMRALGHTPPAGPLRRHDSTVRVANPLEVRPDLILLAPGDTGPWLAVEVQHEKDEDKPRRWLALAAAMHDTRKHMGDLVVVTHDAAVARWASKEVHLKGPSGTRVAIQPLVLCVTRKEAEQLLATGSPDLAVVAAWAVHDQRGPRAKRIVRRAAQRTLAATDLREVLVRAMLSMLGGTLLDELRRTLNMLTKDTFPETPAWREFVKSLEPVIRRIGYEDGLADGEARGKAEGEARGEAQALLAVLDARGLAVDDNTRATHPRLHRHRAAAPLDQARRHRTHRRRRPRRRLTARPEDPRSPRAWSADKVAGSTRAARRARAPQRPNPSSAHSPAFKQGTNKDSAQCTSKPRSPPATISPAIPINHARAAPSTAKTSLRDPKRGSPTPSVR
jgi:hypothetical protein